MGAMFSRLGVKELLWGRKRGIESMSVPANMLSGPRMSRKADSSHRPRKHAARRLSRLERHPYALFASRWRGRSRRPIPAGTRLLRVEFTVDCKDADKIAAVRRGDAHQELARWLKGDHHTNNDLRHLTS